jgi:hypothetical protein
MSAAEEGERVNNDNDNDNENDNEFRVRTKGERRQERYGGCGAFPVRSATEQKRATERSE